MTLKILSPDTLFKYKTNNFLIQFFRYTIVGSVAFVFDFLTLFVLTEYFELYYLFSTAIGFFVGLTTNYILSILWVFEKRLFSSKYLEFLLFTLIGLIGLILNELFIWSFTEIIGIHYLWSKIISTVLVYFWNFLVRKFVLF